MLEAAGIDLAVFEVPQDQDLSPDDLYRLLRQAPEDSVIVVDDLDVVPCCATNIRWSRCCARCAGPVTARRHGSSCCWQSSIGRFETYV